MKMKGLHITDLHNDLVALSIARNFALKRNDLEFIVCSGDYLGECLDGRQVEKMHEALYFIRSSVKTDGYVPLKELLEHILTGEKVPNGLKKAAQDYVDVIMEFDINAEKQYAEIMEIFKQFPQKVLTVPGNWDSTRYFKFFEEFDVHKKSREIEGIKFSGYGGADLLPVFFPEIRFINFSEQELHDFLVEEDPDVALTHIAPRGLQDKASERDHEGSWAYLDYIGREAPTVCLVGHSHDTRGISKDKDVKTFVINSGNLGHYEGSPDKGTFYEIEIEKEGIISAVPYKIFAGEVITDENADSINGGSSKKEAHSNIIETV